MRKRQVWKMCWGKSGFIRKYWGNCQFGRGRDEINNNQVHWDVRLWDCLSQQFIRMSSLFVGNWPIKEVRCWQHRQCWPSRTVKHLDVSQSQHSLQSNILRELSAGIKGIEVWSYIWYICLCWCALVKITLKPST